MRLGRRRQNLHVLINASYDLTAGGRRIATRAGRQVNSIAEDASQVSET